MRRDKTAIAVIAIGVLFAFLLLVPVVTIPTPNYIFTIGYKDGVPLVMKGSVTYWLFGVGGVYWQYWGSSAPYNHQNYSYAFATPSSGFCRP